MRGQGPSRSEPFTHRPMRMRSARPARRRECSRSARAVCVALLVPLLICTMAGDAGAQVRVGRDSSTRLNRFGRDLAYGTALGFGYAGVDQLRDDPPEWGKGWRGYGKRLASNVGEFVIQESVTDALAAAMHRPLDYRVSHSRRWSRRLGWALQAAVTDPMPDGTHPVAVPRIVGAYAGSIAQASWRPATAGGRTRTALVNGTVSLAIGAAINVYHEWRGR